MHRALKPVLPVLLNPKPQTLTARTLNIYKTCIIYYRYIYRYTVYIDILCAVYQAGASRALIASRRSPKAQAATGAPLEAPGKKQTETGDREV